MLKRPHLRKDWRQRLLAYWRNPQPARPRRPHPPGKVRQFLERRSKSSAEDHATWIGLALGESMRNGTFFLFLPLLVVWELLAWRRRSRGARGARRGGVELYASGKKHDTTAR